ncbi:MAG: ABC transporter permease subunit [Planctomycetes bacterium]|nr:ABC transporter permease subunit [Planctomycetota bacterium]
MNLRRLAAVFRATLAHNLRRPLVWVLLVVLALFAYGLVTGAATISTGDSDTGGKKAWITSMFAMAQWICVLVFLLHGFFVAIATGMVVIHDDESKITELLHSTPLTVREYVWGKWLAHLATFCLVLAAQLVMHAVANHLLSSAELAEHVGPFEVANYVVPALVFGVPTLVLIGGVSFAIGLASRRAIPVFAFPAALLMFCMFFLWSWNPAWLLSDALWLDRVLQWVDPSGLRWLRHSWLDVDRGVEFYNHQAIGVDLPFAVSRFALIAVGLGAVLWAERNLRTTLRGARGVAASSGAAPASAASAALPQGASLASLGMSARRPGLWRGMLEVARVELRELRSQPGLYLFVPLILVQVYSNAMFRVGPFDTPLLATSGSLAASSFNSLTLLVCLLLLFYTVESLERERARGLAPIYYSTPTATASLLFGKALANSLVGIAIVVAAWVACASALLAQGTVGLEFEPFLIVWGALLVPTFFAWSAFVCALHSLSRNRYASYALALGALAFTGYRQMKGEMNWAGNWSLWNAVRWSDLGLLELDSRALLANRVLYLSLGVALTFLAVRFFPRRTLDAARVVRRLQPAGVARGALALAPAFAPALGAYLWLDHMIDQGRAGEVEEKRGKDYWRKNSATWRDAKNPTLVEVVVDLELQPEESRYRCTGTYTLLNDHPEALRRFALTPGPHYEQLAWTLAGRPFEPENRCGLHVFELESALQPGQRIQVGFQHAGRFPNGVSKNGEGASEFILPSGAVLTAFGPAFVPSIGFVDGVGIDDDNRADAKEYADDFYVGETRSGLGNNSAATTRITLHVPQQYQANSVGVLESESVEDGVRTCVWVSDYPVEFFNVVCGKWEVLRGRGTALYFHPGHAWNTAEMLEALDGAREHFSHWFHPYPWRELKVSEFAGHASYAQGFPTNISFSENIGFLAKSDPRSRIAFMVTAHEAAHQWWGNLLNPGEGPGGNVLSEGMAHFSTALLIDELRGLRERIEFLKRIETSYARARQVDSEKPLVKVDGSREGDTTVTYDKGGWVMWMLLNHMGRDAALAGLQGFIRQYHGQKDHPVLQDFVASMRPFAPDAQAFDSFVQQWFSEVVVPEYQLSNVVSEQRGEHWFVEADVANVGTGRMPVVVCVARGERFPEDDDGSADPLPSANSVQAAEPARGYRDARSSVTVGPGETAHVQFELAFEPQRILVDPDALVLQLRREMASKTL